ncbi:MAG: alpha/beta hydrolase family protein [Candidatus Heimdallarchaeota archaeon]
MNKNDIKFFKRILILVGLLIGSLIYLHFNRELSYYKYDRIEFQSSGATLYANLYYPSRSLEFQSNKPLVIYCHGIGSQRDFDLRIPIELTKRGFYVAALDYHGHGESGGSITDVDPSGIPALAQDCSILLDKLETLPFYSDVNASQIGLIGHSLGGMVVLMNQALDSRFNVTVAWAPLVNFDPQQLGIFQLTEFAEFVPVNLLNTTNTHNLLIIMHIYDEMLSFENQALVAQNLTGCSVRSITWPLIGGGHQLLDDVVIIDSIQWFELNFFGSISINGPIFITYYINYVVIFITLGLLFLLILLLISYSSRFFAEKQKVKSHNEVDNILKPEIEEKYPKHKIIITIIKLIFFIAIFILNWELFERIFGLPGIFLASLNILLIYGIVESIIYLRKYRADIGKINLKELFETQISLRILIFLLIYSIYFVIVYFIFLFSPTNPLYSYIIPISVILISLTAITITIAILGWRIYLRKRRRDDIKSDLKGLFKFKIHYKYFIYSTVCSLYFIVIYLIFSFFYPFAFMWPSNYINFILGSITAFPVYFSMEILYRKVIYPHLGFIKNEWTKSKIIIILAIYVQINLISLTWSWAFFPSVMFTYLILLLVVIQNTIIFQYTKSFGSVILSSFIIIQLFFSAVISNALGVSAALHLFVEI